MQLDCNTSVIALVVLLLSSAVNAEVVRENHCVRYGITRTVTLQADNKSGAPCRVLYHKPMEDQSTTNLWNARNDALFCSAKYDAFIVKLETRLNWSCELNKSPDQSLAENELPPESSTVTPGTLEDNESIRNDYAASISRIARSSMQSSKRSESSDIGEPGPDMDEKASRKAAADTNDQVVESMAATTPEELLIESLRPEAARALPGERVMQYTGSALSMKRIETYIPSGNYDSYQEESQSDNSPLCPAGGFFSWSTQSSYKPVFEMGTDQKFHFDLTSLSGVPIAAASGDAVYTQCHPKISAGYCSNEKYYGNTPLHPVLSSYFGCDGRSATSQNHRPLVLVRTLIDSNSGASECNISENYQHLALASSLSSSGSVDTTEKYDIELVILPKRTNSNSMGFIKGYVCRYVRGS